MEIRLLQLGYGKMGQALLDRWATELEGSFTTIDPYADKAPPGIELKKEASGLSAAYNTVIIAVKPHMVEEALAPVLPFLDKEALIISVAAGVPMAKLANASQGRPVMRLMPNLPVLIGKGMCGLVASDAVTQEQRALAETLADVAGHFVWVEDEDALDRFTAVAGSGPGYAFEIARTYIAAAEELGFSPEKARHMVLATLEGSAAMAMQSELSLEDLRDAVTSKKGTTEAGLNVLRDGEELERRFEQTVTAAYKRAIELRD